MAISVRAWWLDLDLVLDFPVVERDTAGGLLEKGDVSPSETRGWRVLYVGDKPSWASCRLHFGLAFAFPYRQVAM